MSTYSDTAKALRRVSNSLRKQASQLGIDVKTSHVSSVDSATTNQVKLDSGHVRNFLNFYGRFVR
jgi:short-subunit dehydrogenase